MPRYFMHLRDGTKQLLDPEGAEHGSIASLQAFVLKSVRDLIGWDVKKRVVDLRFRIDAEDEKGVIVYALPFAKAVNFIPESAANDE